MGRKDEERTPVGRRCGVEMRNFPSGERRHVPGDVFDALCRQPVRQMGLWSETDLS